MAMMEIYRIVLSHVKNWKQEEEIQYKVNNKSSLFYSDVMGGFLLLYFQFSAVRRPLKLHKYILKSI